MTASMLAIVTTARLTAATLRRVLHHRGGNAALEMAFTSVPLVLFLFAIITTGQAMWLQNALNTSVADAARCASVNPDICGSSSQVQAFAAQQTGAGFDSSVFSVNRPSCGNQVSASYPLSLGIPFASLSVTLTAQACFPV
jgi:hypothetical protein